MPGDEEGRRPLFVRGATAKERGFKVQRMLIEMDCIPYCDVPRAPRNSRRGWSAEFIQKQEHGDPVEFPED
jgi:hypothetical protein